MNKNNDDRNQPKPGKRRFIFTASDKACLAEKLPIAFFALLSLFSVATYIAYTLSPSKDNNALLDYASYAFPALAAVAAGLNISLRREALWFWVSAILVFTGLIAYVIKNDMLGRGVSQLIYFTGIVAIIATLVIVSRLQDGPWKRKLWVDPFFGWSTIILITLQCCLVIGIDRRPQIKINNKQISDQLQCQTISGDLQSGLVLSCTKKR